MKHAHILPVLLALALPQLSLASIVTGESSEYAAGLSCGDIFTAEPYASSVEAAADADARTKCAEGETLTRVGDYALSQKCLVHNTVVVIRADAQYQCGTVTGKGEVFAGDDTDADPQATVKAENKADQDAQSQCGALKAVRVSDYEISGRSVACGAAYYTDASAQYVCEDPSGPKLVVGQAQLEQECRLGDVSDLVAPVQEAAVADAQAQCGGGAATRVSDFTDQHGCTPLNVNDDRRLLIDESAVFECAGHK